MVAGPDAGRRPGNICAPAGPRTGALPPVDDLRAESAAGAEVDRHQDVTLRTMTLEGAGAGIRHRGRGHEAEALLQELVVEVARPVVDDTLAAEKQFGARTGIVCD